MSTTSDRPPYKELDLSGLKELTRNAFTDVSDADRCTALHITPATGTLHRRLRETANGMNALIAEIEHQRMMVRVMTPGFESWVTAIKRDPDAANALVLDEGAKK